MIRTAQYTALTLIALLSGLFIWANRSTDPLPDSARADRIVVEKSKRIMTIYQDGVALRSYKVSLGRVPSGAKEKEGDKKTPEGTYQISEHFEPSAFHRSLRISYPDQEDIARARTAGVSAGSNIMIHGIRNRLGFIGKMHLWLDWTAGCIAVTNPEIEELWRVIPDGTEIEIRP